MDINFMIAVVQCYIHVRKGVEVQISTFNLDFPKLLHAYNIANDWFNNNNGQIGWI